jgi:hypothetical protein
VHDKRGRPDLVGVGDWRVVPEDVLAVGRDRPEVPLEELEGLVGRAVEAKQVVDAPLGDGRLEAVGLADDPGAHVAAEAAAGDELAVGVDVVALLGRHALREAEHRAVRRPRGVGGRARHVSHPPRLAAVGQRDPQL